MRLRRCMTPSEAARGAWRPRQHDRRLRACDGQGKQWKATVTWDIPPLGVKGSQPLPWRVEDQFCPPSLPYPCSIQGSPNLLRV
jgi:hypothetical protein